MIYVFYHNDPLAQDLGGGAEHFRCLHRALTASELPFRLVAARLQDAVSADEIVYISRGSGFLRFYLALWVWFWRHRGTFSDEDVFHFHRNYAAWPKLVLAPRPGRVLVSYHNVTGRVLEGWLGRLAAPMRRVMLAFERRVAALADAIICVSGRDRRELARVVAAEPFSRAHVVPAAYDEALFEAVDAAPPCPELARRLLILGRISHQKNVPLAVGDPGSAQCRRRALAADHRRPRRRQQGADPADRPQPGRRRHPLDRRRAARRGAGTAARAWHPAADQPLRGVADRGQGGPAGDAPGGQHRRRRRRRLAGEGPHRVHLSTAPRRHWPPACARRAG